MAGVAIPKPQVTWAQVVQVMLTAAVPIILWIGTNFMGSIDRSIARVTTLQEQQAAQLTIMSSQIARLEAQQGALEKRLDRFETQMAQLQTLIYQQDGTRRTP